LTLQKIKQCPHLHAVTGVPDPSYLQLLSDDNSGMYISPPDAFFHQPKALCGPLRENIFPSSYLPYYARWKAKCQASETGPVWKKLDKHPKILYNLQGLFQDTAARLFPRDVQGGVFNGM
jgi:hypothetical protein